MSRPWRRPGRRPTRPGLSVTDSDADLLSRLRSGDERAFVSLVERYHAPMLQLAVSFVPSHAVAEEVVQDTWLARFAAWRVRGTLVAEDLAVPHPGQPGPDDGHPGKTHRSRRGPGVGGGSVEVRRVRSWADPPERWIEAAEGRVEAGKLAYRIRSWIDELPARQREVVLLRDVEGMSSEEVCAVLELSDVNQRVLLHRGRSRLRQLFEASFGRCDEAPPSP